MVQKLRSFIKQAQQLVAAQNKWRGTQCINLIASENVMSPLAKKLYVSDFMHRYAEGTPFKRYYAGVKYVDEIESLAIELAKKLFRADWADMRPLSGAQAILIILSAYAKPGERYVAPSVPAGAHISQAKFGCGGIRGLEYHEMPLDIEEMNLDVEKSKKVILRAKPKLVNCGGTIFLFPHPLAELKEAAEKVGAVLTYDASHVLGLIAGRCFQDPLREGADVIGSSTHKTFPGPQGGMIFGSKEELYKPVAKTIFPSTVSNHHLHRLPAMVVTLAEMLEFGEAYAKQIIKNAQALAQSLHELGFDVVAANKGFTKSHQVLVDVSKNGGGDWSAKTLERANIILNKNLLPWDDVNNAQNPSGIRIGTPEMTHFGMKEPEMGEIAQLIGRVVIKKENPTKVKKEVVALRKKFQKVKYCFKV